MLIHSFCTACTEERGWGRDKAMAKTHSLDFILPHLSMSWTNYAWTESSLLWTSLASKILSLAHLGTIFGLWPTARLQSMNVLPAWGSQGLKLREGYPCFHDLVVWNAMNLTVTCNSFFHGAVDSIVRGDCSMVAQALGGISSGDAICTEVGIKSNPLMDSAQCYVCFPPLWFDCMKQTAVSERCSSVALNLKNWIAKDMGRGLLGRAGSGMESWAIMSRQDL